MTSAAARNTCPAAVDDLGLPDAQLGLYARALVTDHQCATSQLVFHPSLSGSECERLIALFEAVDNAESGSFQLLAPMAGDLQPEQYKAAFDQVQRYIRAGDCYQINLTQRFRAPCRGDPWHAYRALRKACPTPFSGYQQLADGSALLSFSPERFIRVSQRRGNPADQGHPPTRQQPGRGRAQCRGAAA